MDPKQQQPATHSLKRLTAGDVEAAAELWPQVYDELRALAQSYFLRERSDHTLQPTALVNEAYLRLIDQTQVNWESRAHFFATAATMMRRLLIDHARKRLASKRGGGRPRVTLSGAEVEDRAALVDLLALDEALEQLQQLQPRHYRLAELRVYGGLTNAEIAGVLGVSTATVERDWRGVQAFLSHCIRGDDDE